MAFHAQWFFEGRKLGYKYGRFLSQISIHLCSKWLQNGLFLEMGGDGCSHHDGIIVSDKKNDSEAKFSPTFAHFQRKLSCHMEILAIFFVAILFGK